MSNGVASGSNPVWVFHGSTHLCSMDEYPHEFLDTRRRLEDSVSFKEFFDNHGSAMFSLVSRRRGRRGTELT